MAKREVGAADEFEPDVGGRKNVGNVGHDLDLLVRRTRDQGHLVPMAAVAGRLHGSAADRLDRQRQRVAALDVELVGPRAAADGVAGLRGNAVSP